MGSIIMNSKNIERWLLYTKISIFSNVIIAFGKLVIGIFTFSIFLCINALYNLGMAMLKFVAIQGYKHSTEPANHTASQGYKHHEYTCYFRAGMTLTLTSLIYIIYCTSMFIYGNTVNYSESIAIIIATITFTEIGVAAYGLLRLRKHHFPAMTATRLGSLSSSLISLVLTQTALLSLSGMKNYSVYNGVTGIIIGFCTALIGIFMTLRISKFMNSKI